MLWYQRVGAPIQIDATDIEPELTLQHPLLTDDIRGMVTFLPACSIANFTSASTYDAVICMIALCYLSEEEQLRAIWKMSMPYSWQHESLPRASVLSKGAADAQGAG
jgi:hypothetical protein